MVGCKPVYMQREFLHCFIQLLSMAGHLGDCSVHLRGGRTRTQVAPIAWDDKSAIRHRCPPLRPGLLLLAPKSNHDVSSGSLSETRTRGLRLCKFDWVRREARPQSLPVAALSTSSVKIIYSTREEADRNDYDQNPILWRTPPFVYQNPP